MDSLKSLLALFFDRRVNLRVLAVLVVAVLVLGGTLYGLHEFQVRRCAGYVLDKAHQAQDAGDIPGAIRNLEQYLALVPDDADAMGELGLLLAEKAPSRRAYKLLEASVRHRPGQTDAYRKLAELAIRLGRFSDAREHLENHLLVVSPGDDELLEMLAGCQAAQGQYQAASDTLARAISSDPGRAELYARRVDLLQRRLDLPDEAARCMHQLVEKNPDSARAHVLRGGYLRSLQRTDEAAAEAAKALALAPDEPDALWLAARVALDQGRLDEARDRARRGVELAPKHVRMVTTLAEIEQAAGRPEEAVRWLQRGLEENPQQADLLRGLVVLLIGMGRADEALAAVETLRAAGQPGPLADYFQARIEYLRGHWKAAADGLERVRPGLDRWPDLQRDAEYWLGRCYGQLGATDLQLAAFRRAVTIDRLWAPARQALVEALLASGRPDEALAEQRELLKLRSSPASSLGQLARILFQRTLQREPDARDWKEVQQAIDALAKAHPGAPELSVLRAEVLVAQGRTAEAEKLLDEAIKQSPERAAAWVALAELLRRQRAWGRVEKLLDEAAGKLGDQVVIRLARGRYLVARYAEKAAPGLRKLAEDAERFPETQATELWRGLAVLSLRAGDRAGAGRLVRLAAAREPNDLELRLLRFELALRAADRADMDVALEEIRRIEGEGPLWHYGQAVRLWSACSADHKEGLPKALDHLAEAGRLRPNWGRVPLLVGQIRDLEGNQPEALEEYLRAFELGELDAGALRRALQLLYAAHRYEEADQLIGKLEKRQGAPLSGELGRMASDLSLRMEDFDRALQTARRSAADSRDYRDHLWLGQVLAISAQRAKEDGRKDQSEKLLVEAEKALRQAVTLSDRLPQTWIPLVRFLARTGKLKQAEQAIAQAEAKIPADQANMAVAEALELVGKLSEAAGKYEAALAAAPNDPAVVRRVTDYYLRTDQVRNAREQLERLVSGRIQAGPSELRWARRRLAMVLAARPGPERCKRALELIDQNLESPQPSVADRRARAIVLLAASGGKRSKEAIQELEDLSDEQKLVVPEDRLLLARLYLAEGDWPKARKLLRGLAISESAQPRYLAAYVEALADHGEAAEAAVWLKRLEGSAPGDFVVASLQARVAFRQEQNDRGIRVLQQYVEKPDSRPPDRDQRLRLAAAWLDGFARGLKGDGQAAQATTLKHQSEAMLRECVKAQPGQALPLVAVLARDGRLEEAAPLAQQAVASAKPAAMAQICGVLLGDARAGPRTDRAAEVLEAALGKHPDSTPLEMMLADARTAQGRLDEAEAAYRNVLTREKDNAVAMNNLAVLLALRRTHLDESLELIQKAIQLAGPESTLLDSRAIVYLARKQPEEALADLAKAIAEVPRPTRYFHRAQAYYQTGKKKLAAESLQEAHRRSLSAELLHPLERPAYQRLRAKLE